MSSRASEAGNKRRRQQQVEGGRGEPASMKATVTAHPEPLTLLAVLKLYCGTLVWLQLCNQQGAALFSFVRFPPRVPRPLAGAPVYDMSLTHAERLRVVGCGFKGKLVRLLSLGVGHHFEPQRNWVACHKLMQSIARRVTAGLVAAVRNKVAKEAEELCASGRFAAAVIPLEQATNLGDLPSRALNAWVVTEGREEVAKDANRAFQLAEEGARAGCHHCQGVMAFCCAVGCGCEADEALGLELAQESSGRGSKYGQFALGWLHQHGDGGLAQDYAQAVAFYRLAAAQGLDGAQCMLGFLCLLGQGVAENYTEAQRLFQLSAAQGHPVAFFCIGVSRELGRGVRQSGAAAIRWYSRAQAAGVTDAADALRRLRA